MVAAGVLDPRRQAELLRLPADLARPRRRPGLRRSPRSPTTPRNRIRSHEHTTPVKEDDRVRQIEAVNAQTGPVMLGYPDGAADRRHAGARRVAATPTFDVTADDGVRHQLWVIGDDATDRGADRARSMRLPALYIADGHHRSAAAARVAQIRAATARRVIS